MRLAFFLITFLFLFKISLGQNQSFKKDSVITVVYSRTSTIDGYSYESLNKLLIGDTVSYYFILNPGFVLEEANPYATIIKNKKRNYLLLNGPMPPKLDRNNYFYDTLFPMKWHLTNKSKTFNGKIGYEATTSFRGRLWTAYYDPLIALNDGPMKFGGLPGLIIKLYDSDKIFDFELTSIEKAVNNFKPNNINIAGDFELFKKLYPVWRKKFNAAINSNKSTDPNCVGCSSAKNKSYSLEPIYEPEN